MKPGTFEKSFHPPLPGAGEDNFPRNLWGGGILFAPDKGEDARRFAGWLRGRGYDYWLNGWPEVRILNRDDPFHGPGYTERRALYAEWIASPEQGEPLIEVFASDEPLPLKDDL